jgi:lysozyme
MIFLLTCILTACTQRPPSPAAPAFAPALVTRPDFGDADPHDWESRPPRAYTVHGIDVSRWQGNIDWPAARAHGVSFAWLKATEGGDVLDPAFHSNWAGAARAAIPRGAYHFYYFCRPAAEQARWFIRHVPRSAGALPPVLDMEWNHKSRTCPHRPDAAHIRREAALFLAALQQHYGQRPLLYTTVDFYHDNQLWRLPGTEFWLRSTAAHPSDSFPGRHWTFWQYSGTGLVPGISGKTDLNAFAGSESDWQSWLLRRRLP